MAQIFLARTLAFKVRLASRTLDPLAPPPDLPQLHLPDLKLRLVQQGGSPMPLSGNYRYLVRRGW